MDPSEHYKAKYVFYKNKCRELKEVLTRLQNVLNSQPELGSPSPVTSPCNKASSAAAVSSASAFVSKQEGTNRSPILGGNAKRQLFLKTSEEAEEDLSTFELGSNKWECEPLDSPLWSIPSASQLELKPPPLVHNTPMALPSSPLQRLKTFRKYSGLETRTSVSCKIKGHHRRLLPGQTCDKCESYYEAAGLTKKEINQSSRHRSLHKRLKSPKGFWDLSMDHYKPISSDSPPH
ncbi:DNA endonuclease RBBP8 [Frankliniella fusca]|uniref:DNA endonuclease RBBP8 n=1 Tax=Frankliniella fusca TaxID=407009 RepID=A0AAE1LJU8_9NEOP|nr:DNA endonuclease RBBP8 [Frankliniella fusca]